MVMISKCEVEEINGMFAWSRGFHFRMGMLEGSGGFQFGRHLVHLILNWRPRAPQFVESHASIDTEYSDPKSANQISGHQSTNRLSWLLMRRNRPKQAQKWSRADGFWFTGFLLQQKLFEYKTFQISTSKSLMHYVFLFVPPQNLSRALSAACHAPTSPKPTPKPSPVCRHGTCWSKAVQQNNSSPRRHSQ